MSPVWRDRANFVVNGQLKGVRSAQAFRGVWLGASFHPHEVVATELYRLGARTEWSSLNLLAVDAGDARQARAVEDYLSWLSPE